MKRTVSGGGEGPPWGFFRISGADASDIDEMVTVAALLPMFNKYQNKKGYFIHLKLIQ